MDSNGVIRRQAPFVRSLTVYLLLWSPPSCANAQPGPGSLVSTASSSQKAELSIQNKPERIEWLQDAGFGLFVHWSVDSQLGSVISHSLVGASDDYTSRYFSVSVR